MLFLSLVAMETHGAVPTDEEGALAEEQNRTVDLLLDAVRGNDHIINQIRAEPVQTLTDLTDKIKREHPPITAAEDKITFRVAVIVLGVVIIGIIFIIGVKYVVIDANSDLKIPEVLVAMGSTALGALAGLLSPSGRRV